MSGANVEAHVGIGLLNALRMCSSNTTFVYDLNVFLLLLVCASACGEHTWHTIMPTLSYCEFVMPKRGKEKLVEKISVFLDPLSVHERLRLHASYIRLSQQIDMKCTHCTTHKPTDYTLHASK